MFIVLETYTGCLPETPTRTFSDYDSAIMHLSDRAHAAREYIDLHIEGGVPSADKLVDDGAKVWAELEHRDRQPFWVGKIVRLAAEVNLSFQ